MTFLSMIGIICWSTSQGFISTCQLNLFLILIVVIDLIVFKSLCSEMTILSTNIGVNLDHEIADRILVHVRLWNKFFYKINACYYIKLKLSQSLVYCMAGSTIVQVRLAWIQKILAEPLTSQSLNNQKSKYNSRRNM